MDKKLIIILTVGPHMTNQKFDFEGQVSGLEALALWRMVQNMSINEQNKLLNKKE